MQGSWQINFTHQYIVVFRCNCRHSMSQVHKDGVLSTQVVNVLEAMEKHSWPNGDTSWNDTVKLPHAGVVSNVLWFNFWITSHSEPLSEHTLRMAVNALEAMEKHSWLNGVTSWNDTVKLPQAGVVSNVLWFNFWITSHSEPLSEHTLRMALYRERRNSSTILVVNCLSELNICWDLHGLHRRPFKSQQMLGSEKWDPTKLWWWMIWEVLVCRASNIFSRSCLQRWMTLRFGNACRRAFQEHWSNCAHWMCLWRYSDVLKQMAFLQRLDRMWRITLAAMYNDYMLELYQKRKQMTSLLWLWRCECRAHELKMATPLLWDLPPWLLMHHSVDHLEVSIISCGGKSRHRGVANFNWGCRNYAFKWKRFWILLGISYGF